MKRSTDRILTTHVGSIPRPADLLALGNVTNWPPKDPAAYEARMTSAVAEVVRAQAAHGIDIVNDGEYGKESWAAYVMSRISGFEHRPEQMRELEWLGEERKRFPMYINEQFPTYTHGAPTDACTGPIAYRAHDSLKKAVDNLVEGLKGADVAEAFMTAVAPASTAFDGVNEYYPNEHDYVFAIAEALREEYLAIHNAGLLVQVDDAVLANMYDALMRQSPERYREWAQLRVDAPEPCVAGHPGRAGALSLVLRLLAHAAHVGRGHWKTWWASSCR